MDPRLAARSRAIEASLLGQRLKAARVAQGLTQAQAAGEEVSAAYVSRIEAGQRRPEALLLERLAARLGISLEDLLADDRESRDDELRVQMDHAELSMLSGDATGALDATARLLADPDLEGAGLTRRARQTHATALEALGRSDEAVVLLEDLVASPRADVDWVRSVIALSRLNRHAGDFNRAISVGELALPHVEELGLAGTTEAIQLSVTVAAAYQERGDLAHALAICQRCADDAERVGSPVGKASAYWNASIIESERGNQPASLRLAQRAIALFELGEDSRNLGRLRTQIAFVHLLQSPPGAAEARDVLDLAERELEWSSAGRVDRARHQLMRGRAELLLGEIEAARLAADACIELAGEESPPLLAEAYGLAGRVRAADDDAPGAREWYHRAITILAGVGVDRDVARLWFELASLLEDAGDPAGALDAYRRGAGATGLADARSMSERIER